MTSAHEFVGLCQLSKTCKLCQINFFLGNMNVMAMKNHSNSIGHGRKVN